MIEEEYISFETAKLAKEKEFDEEFENMHVWNNFKGEILEDVSGYNMKNSHLGKNSYSAPTQSLLARWLREKHKLFIEVTVDFIRLIREGDSTKYYPIYYYKIVNLKNADYTNNKEEFRFYEEAMEAGLQDALKLL